MTAAPADFGGSCLIGECDFAAELLLPQTTYLGLQKAGSYLYGTLRDEDGNLLRMLRAVDAAQSTLRSLYVAEAGGQLQRHSKSEEMWCGPTVIALDGNAVEFSAMFPEAKETFRFIHNPGACTWDEPGVLAVTGVMVGPAVQWFNTWRGGGCLSATAKYRASGIFLDRPVQGFVGHEIHYLTPGFTWLTAPYGRGREICWQQIANEYIDGSTVQATFAYGADGWGFAMLHDERGYFTSTTEIRAEATVRPNGYPETVRYFFADQSWTWRIDPQGERPSIDGISMLGADGICSRDGDSRGVRFAMGNSDWWTDGRAERIILRDR